MTLLFRDSLHSEGSERDWKNVSNFNILSFHCRSSGIGSFRSTYGSINWSFFAFSKIISESGAWIWLGQWWLPLAIYLSSDMGGILDPLAMGAEMAMVSQNKTHH